MMDSSLTSDLVRAESSPKLPFWEPGPRRIFVYGTGAFARDIQRALEQKGITIAGFIDHRKNDLETKDGIPIFQRDAESITKNDLANSVVLLGIHNREAKVLPIISNLKELGCCEIVSPVDLYDF